MDSNRTRLAMVAGTTLALVLSGASIVSAQSPDQTALGGDNGSLTRGPGRDFGGGRGDGGRGGFAGGILDRYDSLVSQEVVTVDADGNILTSRVEHGTVSAVADGSMTIDLASGESVTITTDANTSAYGWTLADRPAREEIALADIAAGSDVLVWSESQDDGSFLAQRVAVLPEATTTITDPAASPEASPAAVG